jgi:hypothetical protein
MREAPLIEPWTWPVSTTVSAGLAVLYPVRRGPV